MSEPIESNANRNDSDVSAEKEDFERVPLTEVAASTENNEGNQENPDQESSQQPLSNGVDTKKKPMETLEIEGSQSDEQGDAPNILQQIISQDRDDLDEEAQGLLADSSATTEQTSNKQVYCCYCLPSEMLGNCTVFLPSVFQRSGWGIVGPHWFGPPCVAGIILSVSAFFIRHAFYKIGYISGTICVLWTGLILFNLLNASYRDPGIVRKDETPTKQHRWCELCKNYQPPKAAHCPDCNACIAGFDHHCVWMGCCIGKKNLRPFTLFNISWLLYLGYCMVWVSVLGPLIFHHKKH